MIGEDWNNVRIVLEVARTGSFSKAAVALGMDQATVSRRVAALEARAGVPLFARRTTGTRPTDAGRLLVEAAEHAAAGMDRFQRTLRGISGTQETVSISTSEGIATYLLGPVVAGIGEGLPLYLGTQSSFGLPKIVLAPPDDPSADIELLLLGPREDVPRPSEMKVRRLGEMRFVPVAGRRYFTNHGTPETFAALKSCKLLNHHLYQFDAGLTPWNELVNASRDGVLVTVPTTSALHRPTVAGAGVSLMPDFSHLLDEQITVVPAKTPHMAIDLWLASHRENLKVPAVRVVFDAVSEMFSRSHWFASE